MPAADTARLIASLELKDLFTSKLTGAEKALGSFDKKLDTTQGRAFKAGQQIGTGIRNTAAIAVGGIGFLVTNIGLGLKSLTELDDAVTQTNAVLSSTKGVAGQTADSVRKLAEQYESLNATIDDKVIQSGENLLLTFTNIRKDAFEPALKAALDMNQALGGGEAGLQGTIQKVGKALNDPIKGLTSLARVGITFTKGQQDQIKAAVAAGDSYKAQGIILGELDKRFGGSFLAGGATTTGKIAKFKDSIDDLQRALATALLPTIGKVADGLTKFLADPAVVKGAKDLGQSIASLFSDENLAKGADFLKGAFETAKSAAPVIAAAAKTTFGFVQAAVGVFKTLPKEVQALLVGGFAVNKLTGGLVTNIAGGIVEAVGKGFLQRGGTPASPLFVSDVSGGLGKVAGGAAGGALSTVAKVFMVGAAVGVFAELAGILGKQGDDNKQLATDIGTSVNNQLAGGASLADLHQSLDAVNKGIQDFNGLNAIFSSSELDALRSQRDLLQRQIEIAETDHRQGDSPLANTIGDHFQKAFSPLARVLERNAATLNAEFRGITHALTSAKGDTAIAKALKAAMNEIFVKGKGGSGGAQNVVSALKLDLAQTHDPKLQAALREAISKVEHGIIPVRKFVEAQLHKADQIFKSNLTNAQKIVALQNVEKTIGNRNSIATKRVQDKIDAAKRAQVAAQKATTQAVKDKDLSVTTNTTVNVSTRTIAAATATSQRIYTTITRV